MSKRASVSGFLITILAGLLGSLGLLGLLSACTSRRTNEVPNAPKDPVSIWYLGCWENFNQKKWDEFKKCYADNATSQQIGYGKPSVTGPDAIVAASQDFSKTFPDGHGDGLLILLNGNRVASIFLLSGTNTGPILGANRKELPVTNRKISQLFGHYIEFDPSAMKVVKEIGIQDGLTLAYQLGFVKTGGRDLLLPTTPVLPPTATILAKNDRTEMQNLEAEKAQLDAWNRHDAAGVDMIEADEYVLHDIASPTDRNKMQSSDLNEQYWKAFPDSKLNITSTWAAGDYVVAAGTFEGKNEADFPAMNLKKTGKQVSLPFLDIFRFNGGKLREEWLFFDGASFINQLK